MGKFFNANTADMFTVNNVKQPPFLIGVSGGTASGKTSVCTKIIEKLNNSKHKGITLSNDMDHHLNNVNILCMDSFYRNLTPAENELAKNGDFNFDHPDSIDIQMLHSCILDLVERKPVKIPVYDYVNNCQTEEYIFIPSSDVILCEGILMFYFPEIRKYFDMKLFVDTDADIRLARRVQRDIIERGRNLENILHQYITFVKPAFEEFCLPTKKYADIIIPRGAENTIAIDLIVQHIQDYLCTNKNAINGYTLLENFGFPTSNQNGGGHHQTFSANHPYFARRFRNFSDSL